FFFQAEDGIRYRNVTGVQTCALPISRSVSSTTVDAIVTVCSSRAGNETKAISLPASSSSQMRSKRLRKCMETPPFQSGQPFSARSEERRVGTEYALRWTEYG